MGKMIRTIRPLENIINEKRDLTNRLYYCSNSGEGKKIRKEIEKRLKYLDKEEESAKNDL